MPNFKLHPKYIFFELVKQFLLINIFIYIYFKSKSRILFIILIVNTLALILQTSLILLFSRILAKKNVHFPTTLHLQNALCSLENGQVVHNILRFLTVQFCKESIFFNMCVNLCFKMCCCFFVEHYHFPLQLQSVKMFRLYFSKSDEPTFEAEAYFLLV